MGVQSSNRFTGMSPWLSCLASKSKISELPNYDLIIPALAQHGIKALHDHCKLTPGIYICTFQTKSDEC